MKSKVFAFFGTAAFAGVLSLVVSMNLVGNTLSDVASSNIEVLTRNIPAQKKALAQCTSGGYCCTSHVNETCSSGSPDCSNCN